MNNRTGEIKKKNGEKKNRKKSKAGLAAERIV